METIYVAIGGDDRKDGAENSPLATLEEAWKRGREASARGPAEILVGEGTYYLKDTLVFRRPVGKRAYPVTFAPRTGARPVLSGSVRLDLTWEEHRDGIYKADLSSFAEESIDQLFMNGRRQTLARFPSGDPLSPLLENFAFIEGADERVFPAGKDVAAPPPLPHREVYFGEDQMSGVRWKKPEEGILHIFPRENWGCLQFRIRGIDYEKKTILLGEGGFQQNERFAGRPGTDLDSTSRFYIENVFEEITTPGEWYYNREEKVLYFYPPGGIDPNDALLEVPRLKELIRFEGSPGNPCEQIHFKGFRFTGTIRTFLDNYEVPSFGDWKIVRSGALFFENSCYCSLDDCFVDAPGGNGIFLNQYNKGIVIKNSLITECGESGIALVGKAMFTREKSYECPHCGMKHPWGFAKATGEYSSECLIENNLVHDIGVWGKQTAALFMAVSRGNRIRHNEFYNIPRAALCIHDGTYGGHLIENNYMHHTCRETDEHGTFNSWGRDSWWCLAQSHHGESHPAGDVLKDARETVVLRRNRFLDFKGWGIDLDDGSSNYDIYDNVCIGVGIKNREGDYRKVHNNIVYLPTISKPVAIQVGCEENCDAWFNNIVFARQDPVHLTIPPKKGKPVKICDRNLYYSRTGSFRSRGRNFDQWKELGIDRRSCFADPRFKDAEAGDFTVEADSPALSLGFENFPQDEYGNKDFPTTWRDLEPEHPLYDYDTMNRDMLKNLRGKSRPIQPEARGRYILDEELGRTQSPYRFIWNLKYEDGGTYRIRMNGTWGGSLSFTVSAFVESIGTNSAEGRIREEADGDSSDLGTLSLSGEDTDLIRVTLDVGPEKGEFQLSSLELLPR